VAAHRHYCRLRIEWVKWSIPCLLTLTACAAPYRKPCSVTVTVTLDSVEGATERCHRAGVKRLDDGRPASPSTVFNGCFIPGGMEVVTREDSGTLWHEFDKHVWPAYCHGR